MAAHCRRADWLKDRENCSQASAHCQSTPRTRTTAATHCEEAAMPRSRRHHITPTPTDGATTPHRRGGHVHDMAWYGLRAPNASPAIHARVRAVPMAQPTRPMTPIWTARCHEQVDQCRTLRRRNVCHGGNRMQRLHTHEHLQQRKEGRSGGPGAHLRQDPPTAVTLTRHDAAKPLR